MAVGVITSTVGTGVAGLHPASATATTAINIVRRTMSISLHLRDRIARLPLIPLSSLFVKAPSAATEQQEARRAGVGWAAGPGVMQLTTI
jgi:hypothetical protein